MSPPPGAPVDESVSDDCPPVVPGGASAPVDVSPLLSTGGSPEPLLVEPLAPLLPAPVVPDGSGAAVLPAPVSSEPPDDDADADEVEEEDDGDDEDDDDDDDPVPSVSPVLVAAPAEPLLLRPFAGWPGSQANARIAGRRIDW